jgi:molybdopterin converting factor small subunit
LTMAGALMPDPATASNQPRSPRVHVELFGVPRLRAGVSRLAVEAADLGEALRALSRACPALLGSVLSSEGSLQPAYTLNINGQRFTTDPATPLRDGDSLILLAVDVGG